MTLDTQHVLHGEPVRDPALLHGVDMVADCSAVVECIAAAGHRFVARYYARGRKAKILRRIEAQRINGAGLSIVVVWHDDHSAKAGYFTRAQGESDAEEAHARAFGLTQPRGTPIYFAVDYDAGDPDIAGGIAGYFQGVAAGLSASAGGRPWYRIGVYGSGAVCESLQARSLAERAWLVHSNDWRGAETFAAWDLKQSAPRAVCGRAAAASEARGEFGAFTIE